MTEPSVEEIVAKAEQGWALGNGDTLRLIASWRERGEALKVISEFDPENWEAFVARAALKDKP